MKAKIVVLATTCTILYRQLAASQDLPRFEPDGQGGYTIYVAARHFINTAHGLLEGDAYVIPRDSTYRSCALSTPVIPVSHSEGRADTEIELDARWIGSLNPVEGEDAELFTAFVIVSTGSDTRRQRDWFHTGLMHKSVDYVASPEDVHTIASTRGFVTHKFPTVHVDQGDSVQIMLCDIRPGASIRVKGIKVHTYPVQ